MSILTTAALGQYKGALMLGGAVALALAGFAAGWTANGWRLGAELSKQDAQTAKAAQGRTERVLQRTDEVRATEATQRLKADHVDQKTQSAQSVVRVTADAGADELRRLRDDLARVRRDAVSEAATRAGLAAQVASLSDSLGECSGRYQAMARERDDLAVQVSGLLELLPP